MGDVDEDAATAFESLSDPVRVAILRELSRHSTATAMTQVPFAELRRAVGVDDPGRFNYHLDRLQDQFVTKLDDGYIATYAGLEAIGTIAAGTYTDRPPARSTESDIPCPQCGDPLTLEYEQGMVTLRCPDHQVTVQTAVPPSVARGNDLESILAYANDDLQRDLHRISRGYCPVCSGDVTPTKLEEHADDTPLLDIECENCFLTVRFPPAALCIRHPAVVATAYDHGIDIRDQLPPQLEFIANPAAYSILSREPIEFTFTIDIAGDSLTFRVDDELDVVLA